jgi:hypothetical protein
MNANECPLGRYVHASTRRSGCITNGKTNLPRIYCSWEAPITILKTSLADSNPESLGMDTVTFTVASSDVLPDR